MKEDVKGEWVRALRSGKYRQGTGALRSKDDEYCCMGVLCEVLGLEWEDPNNTFDGVPVKYRQERSVGYPPESLCTEIGLRYSSVVELGIANDGGKTFGTIADWIEGHL
jgi:hypothetical protein